MTVSLTFQIKRLNKASKYKYDKIIYLRNPSKYLWGGMDAFFFFLQLMGLSLSDEFYISNSFFFNKNKSSPFKMNSDMAYICKDLELNLASAWKSKWRFVQRCNTLNHSDEQ